MRPDVRMAGASSSRGLDTAGIAAFVAIVVLLGVNFVAVRFSNAELPPFWGAAFRFLVAGAVLAGVVQFRGIVWPRGRALAGAVAYGFLSFGVAYALVYWSLLGVGAGTASVVFATTPLLTLLMAATVRIERIGWRALVGALVALGGMVVVVGGQVGTISRPHLVAVALAAVSGAASGVVVKRVPAVHPVAMNAVGMLVGTAVLAATSLLAREAWALPGLAATWGALAWLVMSAAIAFILFVWLIRRWSASAASYTTVLFPIVTIVVASALIGEPITPRLLAGTLVVGAGVYLGALSGHARAPSGAATASQASSSSGSLPLPPPDR